MARIKVSHPKALGEDSWYPQGVISFTVRQALDAYVSDIIEGDSSTSASLPQRIRRIADAIKTEASESTCAFRYVRVSSYTLTAHLAHVSKTSTCYDHNMSSPLFPCGRRKGVLTKWILELKAWHLRR